MKKFEKWYKIKCKKEQNPNVYYGAELGWKAALEWVLSLPCEPDFSLPDDIIKKELNNE